MTSSIPQFQPQQNALGQMNAGQDFVLFDDPMTAVNVINNLDPSTNGNSNNNINTAFGMAGNSSNNASAFTQYRNSTGSQGTSGSGMVGMVGLNESPFSSPASKPEDDFTNTSTKMFSTNGSNPQAIITDPSSSSSGTLAAQGAPKSKRARGHGYSSSWNGGSLEQHLHQLQQAQAPNMAPAGSFGGFSGSEWSGSDTSPQNPPSGSFGPPIHSLTLGDGGQNEGGVGMNGMGQLASLFPAHFSVPSTNVNPGSNHSIHSDTNIDQTILDPAVNASTSNVNPSQAHLTAQQQEDRARQQIQADLMGVDSRALKGQLRDIKHGAFLPIANPSQGNILFPNVPITPFAGDPTMNGADSNPAAELRTSAIASALASGSFGENQGFFSGLPSLTSTPYSAAGGGGMAGTNPLTVASSNNNFQLPSQPIRKFSERTQNAVNRAKAQKPTRKRMTREGSGLTVSPQEAFLDYEDVDSVLQAAGHNQSRMNMNGTNVFSSAPGISGTSLGMTVPGLISVEQSSSTVPGNSIGTFPGSSGSLTETPLKGGDTMFTLENTPSLIDGSSSNGTDSRGTSAVPSPPARIALSRGDTVRPSKAQQELMASSSSLLSPPNVALQPTQSSSSDQQSSQGSLFSKGDLGMFSPSESANSSTDDEDEKPYFSTKEKKSSADSGGNNVGLGGMHQVGPRFSVVSSSSSESEDDLPRSSYRGRGTAVGAGGMDGSKSEAMGQGTPSVSGQQDRRPRMMGGYGYMGSSEENGLFAQPISTLPFQQQQVGPNFGNWMSGTISSIPGTNASQMNPPPIDTSSAQVRTAQQPLSGDGAASETGSQSQDESSRQSPSIRSSAQVIHPFQSGVGGVGMQDRNPMFVGGSNNRMGGIYSGQITPTTAQYQLQTPFGPINPVQQLTHGADTPKPRNRSRTRATEGNKVNAGRRSLEKEQKGDDVEDDDKKDENDEDDDDWEETEEDEDMEESEGSPFEGKEKKASASSNAPGKSRNTRKNKKSSGGTSSNANTKRKSRTSQNAANAISGGQHNTSNNHITVCDYVSPLTGETCGTEFHRPYDLARHRETIHAREEATLLKQNEITKEQCVVLFKEVDPTKSLATVEWRCDGPNGCGALFSRKDALLRHRRIRNH